jgi:HSP20 family molecular chaperone IbpA
MENKVVVNVSGYSVYPGNYVSSHNDDQVQDELNHLKKVDIITLPIVAREFANLFELKIDIPGIKREEFFIHADRNILSVIVLHGRCVANSHQFHHFTYQCFDQHIALPENVDAEFSSAEYTEGVLWLYLSKTNNHVNNQHTRIVVY